MIEYIDRKTGEHQVEKVFGQAAIAYIYGPAFLAKLLCFLVSQSSFFSRLYGFWQKMPWTRRKIAPFIREYEVDASEFLKKPSEFSSFNDFFVRKLKPEARPISSALLVIPADGRYWFYQNIAETDGFAVKGKKFTLDKLLQDSALAEEYAEGAMVMARLCPSDYHRFHFPCDGTPGKARLINGHYYSVNPIAVRQNVQIFSENKRMITEIHTETFGKVLYLEIGATSVGSINQTYAPEKPCSKGQEKGFFSFGGSALILLFPKNSVRLDSDLLAAARYGLEMRCLMGTPLGRPF